ncbi:MAG: hypothetical protein FJ088_10035, partial [Deltaproteobacteria bacterium]|nr:hypothetical protein [Deltaproteobacteria bacterium]
MNNIGKILSTSFYLLAVSFALFFLQNTASASQISVSTFSPPVNREIADRFISAQNEFDRGNYPGGMKLLREIASLKDLAGMENLPLFSAVLLKRLKTGEAKESLTVRLEMVELALKLAPDMPQPYFKTAELLSLTDSFDLARGSAMLLEGLKKTAVFLPFLSALVRGVSYYTIIVYSIFALIFSILMIVKYFKPISHKLRDFALFITDFQAALLLILILLLPVAANLGVILIAMIYLLASALFQTRRELFLSVALLLSGFVVFACGKSLSLASEFEYGMGKTLYGCLHADCSDYYQNELIKNQAEPLASEALGLFYAKRAHLDERNLKFAERYLKYGAAISADEKAGARGTLNIVLLDLAAAIMECRFEHVPKEEENNAGSAEAKVSGERISPESLERFDAAIAG